MRRTKDEQVVRRMLDADSQVKRRILRPKIWWKYACQRDMTKAWLKEQHNKQSIMYEENKLNKPGTKKKNCLQ